VDVRPYLIAADAVFDGERVRRDLSAVRVSGGVIEAVGTRETLGGGEPELIALPGTTLVPGLIDLHTHLLLHPYAEVPAQDQMLRDPLALRIVRATVAARATLAAGFTTVRDLGTEGAGDADIGLREAFARGVAPGPRVFAATRAIVATGTYVPRGFAPEVCACIPQGAQEADGVETLTRVAREQLRAGADWLKVYADYSYGAGGESRPAFSLDELRVVAAIAHDAGRFAAAHAITPEGMRRATLAGFDTIEHGTDGTPEVFALMAERGTVLCPTLAVNEALATLRGDPSRIERARTAFAHALAEGVTIANGSDAGPFAHGDNATEIRLMHAYGMPAAAALAAATHGAADVLRRADLGRLTPGATADVIAVAGDPLAAIAVLETVRFVMQNGTIINL
jgi:imidazolonepropionase-like amidohydrolase